MNKTNIINIAGEKDFKCWGAWARCATPEDGQFSCVPVYNFCDGVRHCLDGSDEWDICDNCECWH